MAIAPSIPNIVIFLAALSPILITSYFILDSAFNYDAKGYILAIGLLLTQGLGILSRQLWKRIKPYFRGLTRKPTGDEMELNDFCEIFELPYKTKFGIYSAPSTHAVFHSFVFAYLGWGSAVNPFHPGIATIMTLLFIALIDIFYRKSKQCDNWIDISIGIVHGMIFGSLWFWIIFPWSDGEYTYYGKNNPMNKCKLGKTKFKCFKTKKS